MTATGNHTGPGDLGYSLLTLNRLKAAFSEQKLSRPLKWRRFDPGDELSYNITGVLPARSGRVHLKIERFVGGRFRRPGL